MEESLIEKISLWSNNRFIYRSWPTGQTGSIVDNLGNCVFRFVDYIDDGEHRKIYLTTEDELKCPIVACGLVGYWFHKRGELGTKDVFEGYFNLRMNEYIKTHEYDDDAWERDLKKEFVCRRHLPVEKKLIKASEAIYPYVTEDDQTKISNIAKNYIKFARSKRKTLYPPKHPTNQLVEDTFIDAYRMGGPAYECMNWMRIEHNLPYMGPHYFKGGKTEKKEQLTGLLKEHHEVDVPEYVREEFEDFDDGVLMYSNGGLMDEINENLKNYLTQDDRVRYLSTLIQPFKDFADAFYAKERIDERKRSILDHEKLIKDWEKIEDDVVDKRTGKPIRPKDQISACLNLIEKYKKDIAYWKEVQNRFFNFAQHGLTGEFTTEEDHDMCTYLGRWWELMVTFARRLAAVALTYGIKLMDIQEQCKVYLTWYIEITDYVDNKFISSIDYARELLKAIDSEHVEESKDDNSEEKITDKKKMSYLQRIIEFSDNKELDYYLADDNWNREINYFLFMQLSVIYDGQSFGSFIDTDRDIHLNPVSDYSTLYGIMFNEAYRQSSIILKSVAPETKIAQYLEDTAKCLFRGKKAKSPNGTLREVNAIPNAKDMIMAYHIMGMVHVLLSLSEEHSTKIERFLISLSVYQSKDVLYMETHCFENYILLYQGFIVAIINESVKLKEGYDYQSQHKYLYSKFVWYKSIFDEIKKRMVADGKRPNNFGDDEDKTSAPSDIIEELSLPKEMNTKRAQKYFRKAIEKGYIKLENNKLIWIGTGKITSNSQLSYFCGKVYEYQHSESGNLGHSIPEKSLTEYFGVNKIQHLIRQVYNAQKIQSWRGVIDDLFE